MQIKPLIGRLASPALAAYGLKALNAAAAFAATALLARAAGPSVVGNYGFAVLTATLLAVVALRGLDQISLRQIAGDLGERDKAAALGVLRYTLRATAISMPLITLAFLLAAGAAPLAQWLQVDQMALMGASIGIGSAAFYRIGLSVIRALGRPVAGQFFEGLNSFIFVVLVAALIVGGVAINALLAVLLFFACQILSLTFLWVEVRRDTRHWPAAKPADARAMTSAGLPIMSVQVMHSFSDWLLLALIAGVSLSASGDDLGAMRVAMQIILIISMVVSTGETFLAARVASDVRTSRIERVWARHRRATLTMAIIIGPLVAICIIWPGPLLTLAFGPAFAVAAPALAIMAAGQATKIITGPIGGLLAMAGLERKLLGITIISLILLAAAAFLLIPTWGLAGAGTAHAIAITWRNIASYIVARRYLKAS